MGREVEAKKDIFQTLTITKEVEVEVDSWNTRTQCLQMTDKETTMLLV